MVTLSTAISLLWSTAHHSFWIDTREENDPYMYLGIQTFCCLFNLLPVPSPTSYSLFLIISKSHSSLLERVQFNHYCDIKINILIIQTIKQSWERLSNSPLLQNSLYSVNIYLPWKFIFLITVLVCLPKPLICKKTKNLVIIFYFQLQDLF